MDPIIAAGAAGAGVVGALAAVSTPLTKLVETVSAGLGRVYEPTHVRRLARAEGDKMVVLAKAGIEVSEIQQRAAERWLAVEGQRQLNIEAVADKATKELPSSVSDKPVDAGWAARFFDECKDVSDEEMQSMWARLLAGEVAQPGTYSLRTLRVLGTLSQHEASNFGLLCSMTVLGASMTPFFLMERQGFFDDQGLRFNVIQQLEAAGLVQREPLGLVVKGRTGPLILTPLGDGPILAGMRHLPDIPFDIEVGTVSFTQAGQEIAGLWKGAANAQHLDWIQVRLTGQGWRMESHQPTLLEGGGKSFDLPEFIKDYWASKNQPPDSA
ncbi:DUF2806 domain-containing protein [Ideonella alba]|uniref:DUF2806 domain-containing protein n=1 Tax=Ideonella alba TaxID=2824118 RepID=A0A940YMV9_9BURK|nr:DUF2806 domain-containing protein [Ideonella alba]MBQ0932654.1 DUF2806 domain-containing protein [Ideonella alba]